MMRALKVSAGIVLIALVGSFPLLFAEAWLVHWGLPAPWFDPPSFLSRFAAYAVPEGGPAAALGLILLEQFLILLVVLTVLYFWRAAHSGRRNTKRTDS